MAKSSCLVETSNQTIRGFIIILFRDGSSVAAIETLDVDPIFRGKGIGQRLLNAAEDEMFANGIKNIRLEVSTNNLSALRLYEKVGYRKVAFLPSYYSNRHYGTRDAFRMVKTLA